MVYITLHIYLHELRFIYTENCNEFRYVNNNVGLWYKIFYFVTNKQHRSLTDILKS